MSVHDHRFLTSTALAPLETKGEGDGPDVPAAIAEMQRTFEEKMTGFRGELKTANDAVKAATDRADALEARLNRPGAGERKQEDLTPERKAFVGMVRQGRESLGPEEIKALVVSNDTAGGVLAPAEFSTEVIKTLVQISPVRVAARVAQTTAPSIRIPKRTQNLTAYWTGETEDRVGTQQAYGQVEIPVAEMACFVDVSNQLLEDSAIDIESELAFDLAQEFGRLEAAAFVLGNGAKKPTGFLDPSCGVPILPGGSPSGSTLSDKLISAFYDLPAPYRTRGWWMMPSQAMGTIRQLKDASGRYIWVEGLAQGQPPTLLGRPVMDVPDMPIVGGNSLSIVFGDFASAYRIYDRVGLMVLRDPYTQATKGLTRFHARRRVGGTVVLAEALRIIKFAAN